MIFRQLFDQVSGTYSYLLASRGGGEAMIIDPVLEKVDRYLQLIQELDLKLVKAVDTHLHADHITGLGALRDKTQIGCSVLVRRPHTDEFLDRSGKPTCCIDASADSQTVLPTACLNALPPNLVEPIAVTNE